MIFIRSIPNVMQHYGCTAEDARRYSDLRDEGYAPEQAAVMAGLADPPDALGQNRQMAQTSKEKQEAFRARQAMLGRKEVRGIYLPESLHQALKDYAARLLAQHGMEEKK